MNRASRRAEERARRAEERRLARGDQDAAPRWVGAVTAMEPWEGMMLMHFPQGGPFSCAHCEDFELGECEGEGREGFEAVKACMIAKQGEVGVF